MAGGGLTSTERDRGPGHAPVSQQGLEDDERVQIDVADIHAMNSIYRCYIVPCMMIGRIPSLPPLSIPRRRAAEALSCSIPT